MVCFVTQEKQRIVCESLQSGCTTPLLTCLIRYAVLDPTLPSAGSEPGASVWREI